MDQQQRAPSESAQGLRQQGLVDDGFFGAATVVNAMDEYRRNQSGVGQLSSSSSSNPQPANVDEFPPLGRGGAAAGEIGGDRRLTMMQTVAGNFGGETSGFPPGIVPSRSASDSLRVCLHTI